MRIPARSAVSEPLEGYVLLILYFFTSLFGYRMTGTSEGTVNAGSVPRGGNTDAEQSVLQPRRTLGLDNTPLRTSPES